MLGESLLDYVDLKRLRLRREKKELAKLTRKSRICAVIGLLFALTIWVSVIYYCFTHTMEG